MKRAITILMIALLLVPQMSAAQTVPADAWRTFAARVELGTELNVRLANGQRFRATLVGVTDEAVLLQPKTRETVPVQSVAYDAIASLERRPEGGGMSAGKAAAIGVATGVGAFFGIMLIMLAVVAD